MTGSTIIRFVNPWKFRREQQAQRLAALRRRDGDNCRRCKRPMRFDLPDGSDLMPKVEQITSCADGGELLENLCLTHIRCNTKHGCDTAEVKERARIKHEAELFARSKQKRRRA